MSGTDDARARLAEVEALGAEVRDHLRSLAGQVRQLARDIHRDRLRALIGYPVRLRYPVTACDAEWRGALLALVGAQAAVRGTDGVDRTLLCGEIISADDEPETGGSA